MPHKQFCTVPVVSVRTTCWERGARPEGEEHEIIEIGLCFLDVITLEISNKKSILIRPQRSTVSPFCAKLTTLTQEQVQTGMSFAHACHSLKEHDHVDKYAWASFGEDHRQLMERECLVYDMPYPLNAFHLNVRLLTTFHLQLLQAPSMVRTLQLLDLSPLEEEARRADDAAYNTARVLAFFLSRLRGFPDASIDALSNCSTSSHQT